MDTTVRVPITQAEALADALRLYDRLYRDLRTETPESEWDALDGAFRDGQTTLDTLAQTANDLPLSADRQEMVASYLEGPMEDDLEGRRAWMALLPELFVDIRRAEEAEHATLLQGVAAAAEGAVADVWADFEATLGAFEWPAAGEMTRFDAPERRPFVESSDIWSDFHFESFDITVEADLEAASGDDALADEPRPNMSYALAA